MSTLALVALLALTHAPACPATHRVVVVVADGLRPDLITPASMPTITALAQRGVLAMSHHSVFPTVTRVNAASLISGTTPSGHGILGNAIYLPAVAARVLNTGSFADMALADSVLGGQLLTAPTIHDVVQRAGHRTFVASAGTPGSAFVLGAGGRTAVVNTELTIPAALHARVLSLLGPVPGEGYPNTARNARALDALLRIGIDSLCSDVSYLWLSDPDHTTHAQGLGSAPALASLLAVDSQVGALLSGLTARGLTETTDIIVVSDHGFSSHAGGGAPIRTVFDRFSADAIIADGAVYLRPGHENRLREMVSAAQQSPEIGPLFTRDGAFGTLRFDAIGWKHARSGALLYSANWSHAANVAGVAGATQSAGVAGHGSSSPYDVHATFIAAGPGFRQGVRTTLPTSNADVAPTVLALLGLPVPRTMDGRIAVELLRSDVLRAPARVRRDSTVASAVAGSLRYRVTLYRSWVGRTRYVDSTLTVRQVVREH